jgi:hypothetical protein
MYHANKFYFGYYIISCYHLLSVSENMYMFRTLSSLSGIPQGNAAIIFWHKLHSQQLLHNNKIILEHVMSHKIPVCSHTYNNSVL